MATVNDPRATKLLDEIDAWVGRTKSTPGELGQMALNHGGFVPLLRSRASLRDETANIVRDFMAAFPDDSALPRDLAHKLMADARANAPWRPDRHRSLMIKHGYPTHGSPAVAPTPSPAPEAKPRISAAVIRAAKIDGRDLPTFVSALIAMGLDCWRDDRVASGEAVTS